MRLAAVVVLALLLLPTAAIAGPFEDARAAFFREDYQTALRLFQPLADQGNVEAQLYVGRMYESGLTVFKTETKVVIPKDQAEALKWFRKAAEQGNMWAQYQISDMYLKGIGTPITLSEAQKWKSKAVAQQNDWASVIYEPPARHLYAESPVVYTPPRDGVIPDKVVAI